ncbi:MAG: response regulator [Gemmatimonadaceae bacterium]|jgi:signal transduction histidine kinase/ActR/RegA family two-component response regulator|nr:response regulator [Gemmatimonadaceae bacterium]
MSLPAETAPPLRRQLSLRQLLAIGIAATAAYVGALVLWLALVVRPQTDALPRDGAPALRAVREITLRATMLSGLMAQVDVALQTPSDTANLALLAEQLSPGRGGAVPLSVGETPAALRPMFARADDETTLLQNLLLEVVAALRLGRTARASERLSTAHGVHTTLQLNLSQIQRVAVEDLEQRERGVAAIVRRATLISLGWSVFGALLIGLWGWWLLRRLERPIRALERGLARVSSGDYASEVPVLADDELGRVGRLFNEAIRVLRVRARQEGRFAAAGQLLADVAHEVNNPLMAISGLIETRLEDGIEGDVAREDFRVIQRQTRRASKLMGGLLRFVRTTDDAPQLVDVTVAARSAVDLVSYQFGVREIELVDRLAPALPPSLIDPGRFEQVLVNLLSNAVDALRESARPRRLTVESVQRDDMVEIVVADSGPGVDAAMVERLFQPFATSKGTKGNGLGLYISRQLLRDAGGDLRYERHGVRGARFIASVPVASADVVRAASAPVHATSPALDAEARPHDAVPALVTTVATAAPPVDPAGTLAGIRVLVVDDEEPVRAVIARFLRRRGAVVTEAMDGVDALEHAAHGAFDLVLTDLRMPRMDGEQLHAALRLRHPALAARMLMLSGDVMVFADRADALPADRVLLKPIEFKVLEAAIRRVLAEDVATARAA